MTQPRSAALRRHAPHAFTAAVIAIALAAAPARAQSDFSSPVAVSNAGTTLELVSLGFDPGGRALASWRDAGATARARSFVRLAWRDATGGWTPGERLSGRLLAHDVALHAPAAAVLLGVREDPGRRFSRSRLVYARGSSRGRFPPFRQLDRGARTRVSAQGPAPTLTAPQIAASSEGYLIAGWTKRLSGRRLRARFAVAEPGGRFADTRSVPASGPPAVAMDSNGDGVAVWRRGTRIQLRIHRALQGWGPVETIGCSVGRSAETQLSVAAAPGRRIVVAWADVERLVDGVGVISRAWASGQPRQLCASPELERFLFLPEDATSYVTDSVRVLAAVDANGRRIVAFPGMVDDRVRVRVTTLAAEAGPLRFGDPETVSQRGVHAALEDFAVGSGGEAALAWFGATPAARVFASRRGDAGWRDPVAVSADGPALPGSRLAISPTTREVLSLWVAAAPTAGQRVLAASSRSAAGQRR